MEPGGYVAPAVGAPGFQCPLCGYFAQQAWSHVFLGAPSTPNSVEHSMELLRKRQLAAATAPNPSSWSAPPRRKAGSTDPLMLVALQDNKSQTILISAAVNAARMSLCGHCGERMLWVGDRIVWPLVGAAEPPNPDLSERIKRNYLEASAILDLSPRGAAGLLRVCIEELCEDLQAKGEKLDHKIADLVARGLPVQVQQALDVVRVIGNEAVHPGQMDLRDDRATAASLFRWVNYIAERMISEPNRLEEAFNSLPPNKLKGIEDRNTKAKAARVSEPPAS